MANKAISELPQAQNVNNQDLFVLEQSGIAKKLTAETFITEQGIIDALAEALDGHGGIQSVTLQSLSGRVRTYRITFTDGSATTFQVLDGNTIDRIAKTSTAGLTDTYTVFMSDGTTTFFTVTNGEDGTVSEAMLNDALKEKAPAVTETTESSAIANFTDGADDLVMHNIVAEINPVQSGSGDPSPSNIRPISGWTGCNVTRTGKNLVDISQFATEYPTLCSFNNDVLTCEVAPQLYNTGISVWIPQGSTVNCTIDNETATNVRIRFAYADGSVYDRTSFPFNPPKDVVGIRFNWSTAGTFTVTNFQAELGSTATTYEPYQSNTVTVDWQTEAGTVYGGTIDVATGLLTVDRAMVDLGTLSWVKDATTFSYTFFYSSFADVISNNILCSAYKTAETSAIFASDDSVIRFVDTPTIRLRIKDSTKNSLTSAQFKTAMSGVQLVYELDSPQTYQLTPQQLMTLLGTNNVWTDIGNVSVTYPADTKMYIQNLTQPTEDDLVANQAITSGKYFMIGNSLYLALANIASGAQITIGTNAQRVSLADALNTINS